MNYGVPPYVLEYRDTKNASLTIQGVGIVKAKPDVVVITLGVITEDKTVQSAQENNAVSSQAILAALKEMGIDENNITTLSYSITPEYDIDEGKTTLRGYRIEHMYEITVLHVQKAGEVYAVAIEAGANITRGLSFRVSQPDKFMDQALTLAVQSAQEKANVIANALHVTLHPIPISIKEEKKEAYHEAMYTTRIASAPSIQAGEMNIMANIIAVFAYI